MRKILRTRSRVLRKNASDAENLLWSLLRSRQLSGYKFRRQYIIEPYIVDFVCLSKRLIIELDGGQHNDPRSQIYDQIRTSFFSSRNYKIIRFWNHEVLLNIDDVCESILIELQVE